MIGTNIFNKNINSEIFLKLVVRYNQRNDKLLDEVTSLKIIQAMYCNVTFKRIRAIIVAVEKEYILPIFNMSLYI